MSFDRELSGVIQVALTEARGGGVRPEQAVNLIVLEAPGIGASHVLRVNILEEFGHRYGQALHLLEFQVHLHFLIPCQASVIFLGVLAKQGIHLIRLPKGDRRVVKDPIGDVHYFVELLQ